MRNKGHAGPKISGQGLESEASTLTEKYGIE